MPLKRLSSLRRGRRGGLARLVSLIFNHLATLSWLFSYDPAWGHVTDKRDEIPRRARFHSANGRFLSFPLLPNRAAGDIIQFGYASSYPRQAFSWHKESASDKHVALSLGGTVENGKDDSPNVMARVT